MKRTNEWDEIYKNLDPSEIPWVTETPEPELVELIESGKVKPGKALDMCSGTGTNSIYLASKGFSVKGIDISPTAVEIANRRCKSKGLKCSYLVGDVLHAPLNEKFDLVFDRGCFHHIEPKEKPNYIRSVFRFLKHNGWFYLECFSDKNRGFAKSISKKEIETYFGKHFDIKSVHDTIHKEPNGTPVYMYSVIMQRRG